MLLVFPIRMTLLHVCAKNTNSMQTCFRHTNTHTHTTTQARKPVCIFGNSCHVCASNNFFPFTNLTILASLLCGSMSYTSIRIHIKCMQNPKTKTIPCTHYYYFFHSFGHSFHSLVLHHIIYFFRWSCSRICAENWYSNGRICNNKK